MNTIPGSDSYIPLAPIRIVISQNARWASDDLRLAFWKPLIDSEHSQRAWHSSVDQSISEFERRLVGEFGGQLKLKIEEYLDSTLELEGHIPEGSPDSSARQPTEVPENDELAGKRRKLARMRFLVYIERYSSLILSLLPSSVKDLLAIFDDDPHTLYVLLSAFVPPVFGNILGEKFSDTLTFQVEIPRTYTPPVDAPVPPSPELQVPAHVISSNSKKSGGAEDMPGTSRWLWLIANGSLLIPAAILLYTLVWAFNQVQSFQNAQRDALEPIIKHQAELLVEDRERLAVIGKLEEAIVQNYTQQVFKANSATPTPVYALSVASDFYHTVQQGETLYSIGRRYGVSYRMIAAANGIVDPRCIHPGNRLLIPASLVP